MYDLDTPEGMKNSIEWTQKLFDCVSDGATWATAATQPCAPCFLHSRRERT